MRLLVLAPQAVDAAAIRAALPGEDLAETEVLVVSPALNQSRLAFWMSDSDEAIEEADQAQGQTVEGLRSEGARATGTTGEGEPLQAIEDALATFPADRILVFVSSEDERKYREDDLLGQARERFGVPVDERALD